MTYSLVFTGKTPEPTQKADNLGSRALEKQRIDFKFFGSESFFIPLLQSLAWCPGLGQPPLSTVKA